MLGNHIRGGRQGGLAKGRYHVTVSQFEFLLLAGVPLVYRAEVTHNTRVNFRFRGADGAQRMLPQITWLGHTENSGTG